MNSNRTWVDSSVISASAHRTVSVDDDVSDPSHHASGTKWSETCNDSFFVRSHPSALYVSSGFAEVSNIVIINFLLAFMSPLCVFRLICVQWNNTTYKRSGRFNSFNHYFCTIDFTFSQAKKLMMPDIWGSLHLQQAILGAFQTTDEMDTKQILS